MIRLWGDFMHQMTDREYLYFDALNELAGYLGDSTENPISVSLLCLRLDITNEEKGRIFFEFHQVLRNNTFDELTVEKFRAALLKVNARFDQFADIVVIGLIKAFSLGLIPELRPFVETL